jgi:acyl-CoA hydrolase
MDRGFKDKTDPQWQERYQDLLISSAEAVGRIRNGNRVFIGSGCGEPQELVRAMTAHAGELADVEVVQILTTGEAPYAQRNLRHSFRVNSFFRLPHRMPRAWSVWAFPWMW